MTKEDDSVAFLEAFEMAAVVTGLERSKWASKLGLLLVGQAQPAYWAMPQKEDLDYEKI